MSDDSSSVGDSGSGDFSDSVDSSDDNHNSSTNDQSEDVSIGSNPDEYVSLSSYDASKKKFPWLVTAFAVLTTIMLAGALFIFFPRNSSNPVAAVHDAAKTSSDNKSGTLEIEASSTSGDDSILMDYNGGDFELYQQGSQDEPATKYVDGRFYTKLNDEWRVFDASQLPGFENTDLSNGPRSLFKVLEDIDDFELSGDSEVKGVKTKTYSAVVEAEEFNSLFIDTLQGDAATELARETEENLENVKLDIFVSDDDLIQKIFVKTTPKGENEDLATETIMYFSNYGEIDKIEAPKDAKEITTEELD